MPMQEKGDAYVTAWPANVARRFDLSPEYTAVAMREVGVITTRDDEYRLRGAFLREEAVPEVGALTTEQAQAVVAQLRVISNELAESAKTTCGCCGLTLLPDGSCRACGE